MQEQQRQKEQRTAEQKKEITVRLNRIIGQIEGIKKMIADDRTYDDILIQLGASLSSLKSSIKFFVQQKIYKELKAGKVTETAAQKIKDYVGQISL